MDWVEQNIDAYRILTDILTQLRTVLAEGLKENYGSDWASEGLPASVFDELVRTKEDESAVDWYEDEYQELFNYTTFAQLREILLDSPDLFPCLSGLLPTPSLLTARFMELEVLRGKIGRARPVGDVELNFLMKFHLHFRKALEKRNQRLSTGAEECAEGSVAEDSRSDIQDDPTEPLDVNPVEDEDVAPTEPLEVSPIEDEDVAPVEEEDSTDDSPSGETSSESSDSAPRPPQRMASRSGDFRRASSDSGEKGADTGDSDSSDTGDSDSFSAQSEGAEVERTNLASRLERGDSLAILRELFLEVTKLAENLWSSDVPQAPSVWNVVRVSDWYEKNFGPLGLKALSDFYDIVRRVEEKMEHGLARHDLQNLLEEVHFSQILLNLRDMFQRAGLRS